VPQGGVARVAAWVGVCHAHNGKLPTVLPQPGEAGFVCARKRPEFGAAARHPHPVLRYLRCKLLLVNGHSRATRVRPQRATLRLRAAARAADAEAAVTAAAAVAQVGFVAVRPSALRTLGRFPLGDENVGDENGDENGDGGAEFDADDDGEDGTGGSGWLTLRRLEAIVLEIWFRVDETAGASPTASAAHDCDCEMRGGHGTHADGSGGAEAECVFEPEALERAESLSLPLETFATEAAAAAAALGGGGARLAPYADSRVASAQLPPVPPGATAAASARPPSAQRRLQQLVARFESDDKIWAKYERVDSNFWAVTRPRW
jgi:hypothetical protein